MYLYPMRARTRSGCNPYTTCWQATCNAHITQTAPRYYYSSARSGRAAYMRSAVRLAVLAGRLGHAALPVGGGQWHCGHAWDASDGCKPSPGAPIALLKHKHGNKLKRGSLTLQAFATNVATLRATQRRQLLLSLRLQPIDQMQGAALYRFYKQVSAYLTRATRHVAHRFHALVGCCAPHGWGVPKILLWAGLLSPVGPTTYEHWS
jgi:hypothetical protein